MSPYVPDSLLEGEKFILLPESTDSALDANSVESKWHDKALFTNRPNNEWPNPGQCTIGPNRIDLKHFISKIRIPSPPADFEGREVTMNSLIRNTLDRRLVSLVGEDGVGKTAVAAAICRYMADREYFTDTIVYLKAKGMKDFPAFLSGLKTAILGSGNNVVAKRLQELISSSSNVGGGSSSGTSIVANSGLHQINSQNSHNQTVFEEEMIFSCLEPMRMLIVLDHLDDLLADFGEAVTDLRLFLTRLFEQCPFVKILNVSTDTLSMYNIYVGSGIVEYSISLGPLTLNSTLRLFARLAPSLTTVHEKAEFIDCLQPPKQHHVTVHCREVSNVALQILALFGDGHPAKIVHMACESTHESVEELKRIGKRIISSTIPDVASTSLIIS